MRAFSSLGWLCAAAPRSGWLRATAAYNGCLFAAVACALLALSLPAPAVRAEGHVPLFDHVFIILMENRSEAQIIGDTNQAPYINQLAAEYGLATNYAAVSHPSLPNYLALTGGDTLGITTDCTSCFVSAPNLVMDRIVPSGRTWKAYMEGMPSSCWLGDSHLYVQRHDPFVYYANIRSGAQCDNVVSMSGLADDLASADTTPNYVWISPDLCNDMHDCPTSTGDAWLQNTVPTILGSPAFTTQTSMLLITWDEDDDSTLANQVPLLVVSPRVPAGYRSSVPYTHYSLLRTIEDAWALQPLSANDAAATPLSDFFPPHETTPSPSGRGPG